ncbi:STAS domain-containing protein [Streptomyces sp. NPDC048324]|uniref:STAS domain-containing protein n=1 Tax=Streptomyces sp. NPDC048324 TaxID=3157205 RepID=UPI0034204399
MTVHLVGELDADTAPALRETLAAFAARSSGGPLVLDLSGITFCDTAGLYTLLGLRQALPLAGVDVILTGAGAELRAGATRAGLLSQLGLGEDS